MRTQQLLFLLFDPPIPPSTIKIMLSMYNVFCPLKEIRGSGRGKRLGDKSSIKSSILEALPNQLCTLLCLDVQVKMVKSKNISGKVKRAF